MKGHLSSREVNEWLIGERRTEIERHLLGCPECRAEIAHVEHTLSDFRGALHHWSDQQIDQRIPVEWEARRAHAWISFEGWMSFPNMSLAVVVLTVCLILFLAPWHQEQTAADPATDAALLAQVNADVSRTVPRSMEPLAKLVSWNGSSSTGSGSAGPSREGAR